MAASPSRCFLLQIAAALWLFSLFICATARPCRTFFISSYSFSLRRPSDDSNPTQTLTTFTHIRSFIPVYVVSNTNDKPSFSAEIFFDRGLPARPVEKELEIEPRASNLPVPFGFSSYDFSSLRDRTKDILSVVVALLFGVGCGALTAATMYLVWSLFANRYEFGSYDDYVDEDDNDDGVESPKKMGYVKIPAAESVPAPAKEAV
ncbi:uncharacterized protein LOC114753557 [Neltuma alba]|uniref:uncharacterized protein LOC114753557 n=1 Tax=Neltuma alba TaxID=207710 RepID=UPI0010A3DDD1|nr:uncharacterized protein LOC114753557 [Prosopis alba]